MTFLGGLRQFRLPGSSRGTWAYLVSLGFFYWLTGWLALKLAVVGGVVTPIWPPTGIAVAALFLYGYRLWPAITVAALLLNIPLGSSLWACGVIATGNTAAPLAAVWLLRRARYGELDRLRDAFVLVLGAALGAMMISASVGTLALYGTGAIRYGLIASTWASWWAGDATGVLVFAPLLFSLAFPSWQAVWWEIVAVLAVLAVTAPVALSHNGYTFVCFPILAWAAVRLGRFASSLAALLMVVVTVHAAVLRVGPFMHASLFHRMLVLQSINAAVALTVLMVSAAVEHARNVALVEGAWLALAKEQ